MRWRIRNLSVTVEGYNDSERVWLSRFLSYRKTAFRKGQCPDEKRISLFNQFTEEFPTGLAKTAWVEAKRQGFEVEITDGRIAPCEPDPTADLTWLQTHPAVTGKITHQIEAVQAAAKKKRGILWIPTGGGKTEIAIGITKALPCQWLFLVHKIDLLQQTADRYEERTGLPAGIVGDGKVKIPPGCQFVVCSFQTAHRGHEQGKPEIVELIEEWAQGILVDECHAMGAGTFGGTVMKCRSAYYRIGLSATPLARSDDRNLLIVGGLGPVLYRIMPQVLIDCGLLAKPTIHMRKFEHKALKGKTWRGVNSEAIVKNIKRNKLVVDLVEQAEKPCLVFINQIAHGKALVERLEKAGTNTRFAWGEKSTVQRKELITQLEKGYCDVLVCNVVFDVGVDIPSLRSVVIAGGMKSKIAVVQRMGRGMRADAKTGKDTFEVWDIDDRGCGCTKAKKIVDDDPMLDDPTAKTSHDGCRWLEKHTRERRSAYEHEGFEVEIETAQLKLALSP